jgi:acyl phosphate:glycerol-3-phosphate acyltransferase
VVRTGGKKAAIITLLGDMIKGLLPVLAGHWLHVTDQVLAATALAAFLGHLYPLYFGFKGGKGVATAIGVLLGISGWLGLAVVGCWLVAFAVSRISSLSALTASLAAPFLAYWLLGSPWLVGAVALMAVLIYWRHRSNIRNLIKGEEPRSNTRA